MKIALSTAVLASLLAPAFSLSYLEGLSKANPVAAPTGGAANGASYLDALASPGSQAPTGSGMASYLDALPQNAAPSVSGAGISSYANAMGGGAVAAAAPAYSPPPAAPAPVAPAASSGPVAAGGNYLEALASVGSSGAPTGAGFMGYLDALPRAASATTGAGIQTYTDALPSTNTMVGSGSGINTYANTLSPASSSGKSFAPFGAKPSGPSFSGSISGGKIGFTLEASDLSSLVEQLRGSGGTIRLTGTIDNMSVN